MPGPAPHAEAPAHTGTPAREDHECTPSAERVARTDRFATVGSSRAPMTTPERLCTPAALVGVALMVAHHGVAAQAQAQAAAPALAACVEMAGDRERLACYDRAMGRASAPPAASPSTAATASPPAAGEPAAADRAGLTASGSIIDRAWAFDPSSARYDVSLYAPNYFLVARYTSRLNTAPFEPFVDSGLLKDATGLDATEAAFQVSFKFRLWTSDDRRWGAWAAYTQQSHWQLYNDSGGASRPFRDTNYMPELILSHRPGLRWGDLQWNLLNLAFNHQSNGRSEVLSRSWDRIIATVGLEQGNLGLLGRLWWRLPEERDEDDNPTISDYYGWGDLTAIYKWRGQSLAAMVRGNPGTGKGAGQLTWTSAPLLGPLRGYVKLFSGYGETLIDYDWRQTTIGVGVALNDWL